MRLVDLLDLDLLQEMKDDGYVSERKHPEFPLFILNYTDKATYDRVWNDVTRRCRGLIYHHQGANGPMEVVARPFEKFFNYDEPGCPDIDPEAKGIALDKLDGSLGILYQAPDLSWGVATRGSFDSEQARHATALYNEEYFGRWVPVAGWTYLFEIVYPENRIVLDYGDIDDLFLLDVIATDTGKTVHEPAAWPGPSAQMLGTSSSLKEALGWADRRNKEGFVFRPFGTEVRVKVKQEDYVALHRVVFGLNARAVWRVMSEGGDVDAFVEGLPEEFRQWAEDCVIDLQSQHSLWMQATAYNPLNAIEEKLGKNYSRKEFAEEALKYDHPGPIFLALDGKGEQIREAGWKAIYPSHRWAPRSVTEE